MVGMVYSFKLLVYFLGGIPSENNFCRFIDKNIPNVNLRLTFFIFRFNDEMIVTQYKCNTAILVLTGF